MAQWTSHATTARTRASSSSSCCGLHPYRFWSQGRENESEGVRSEGMDGACAKVAGGILTNLWMAARDDDDAAAAHGKQRPSSKTKAAPFKMKSMTTQGA